MKIKIILLLVISSLIMGCVDNSIVQNKTSTSKNIIPETLSDINIKILSDCGTTIQCDDWVENHINGNYVRWDGTVIDASNDMLSVSVNYDFPSGSNGGKKTFVKNQATINLHGLSKEELLKFKKGDNTRFTGKINIKKGSPPYDSYYTEWLYLIGSYIDLYDVNIEPSLS